MARETFSPDGDGADALPPIAIIGMACRFPGSVSTPESFWKLIREGRKCHKEVPKTRFNPEAWRHLNHDRKGAIQPDSGFFLDEDPAVLDAPFFSITAKEAEGMDPMQRKLLEVSYEGFENAGIPLETLAGSNTSVYIGVMTNDYERISQNDIYNLPANAASGTSRAMLANRVSWFFDLHGPSLALDTACSSSLYAFHLACQSLRTGESNQALVGGANMILDPNFVSQLSSMHMLSPDGISHSFDARANGYARGEAISTVVLKRLSDALADGDTIRAIVRGTGVNQDGHTPGITMPSREAQAALIRSTYEAAGLSFDQTSYFEAHGTGTSLGDPLELGAVGDVFGPSRQGSMTPLYVGSVKTNVGHTEGTAGLAGVVKVVLALEKGFIPANAGLQTPNPKFQLGAWGLHLPLDLMPWPTPGLRRASINSFGFGGSNAHAVLDDAYHYLRSRRLVGNHHTAICLDDCASSSSDSGVSDVHGAVTGKTERGLYAPPKLLVFSAHDQDGVKRVASTYAEFAKTSLGRTPQRDSLLHDVAYTLAARRSKFAFRGFSIASSLQGMAESMSSSKTVYKRSSKNSNLAFVFTGQGAQWATMGRELLNVPVFRESVIRSQEYLDSFGCDWNAIELLSDEDTSRLDIPQYCQPICTVLQVALVDLLAHWGVRPAATVGHSSGEMAAAYAAGGISHASAVKVAFFRGIYVDEVQRRLNGRQGTMMAAGLTAAEAHAIVDEFSSETRFAKVACVNSPSSVTLSGDVDVIDRIEDRLQKKGKFARRLRVKTAYHSPHMEVIADDFLKSIQALETTPQFRVPMFSSVTEKALTSPSQLHAAYWVENMVSSVLFQGAVQALLTHTVSTYDPSKGKRQRKVPVRWSGLVEVGPAETLKGPLDQIIKAAGGTSSDLIYTGVLQRKKDAHAAALEAMGRLWAIGHPVDLLKVNEDPGCESPMGLADLPPYPWNHAKRFWHETAPSASVRKQRRPRKDLLGVAVASQNHFEPRWRTPLRLDEQPWMADHVITGTILYPAAGMLAMVLEAALEIAEDAQNCRKVVAVEFCDVNFDRGLVIPPSMTVETSLSVRPHDLLPDRFHWTIFSMSTDATWQKHSFGDFSIVYDNLPSQRARDWQTQVHNMNDLVKRASKKLNTEGFYAQLKNIGMEYGPLFTNMIDATVVPGEQTGYARITVPDTQSAMPLGIEFPHCIHPAVLDAMFHLIFVALFEGAPMDAAAVPVTVERIFISTEQPSGAGSTYAGYAKAEKKGGREASADLVVSDESWTGPKVLVQNMIVRQVASAGEKSPGPNSSSSQPPKRVGRLEWRQDIDTLGVDTTLQLAAWLELLTHKHADLRVLVLHAEANRNLLALARHFTPQENGGLQFSEIKYVVSSESAAAHLRQELSATQRLQWESTDIVLVTAAPGEQGNSFLDPSERLGAFDLIIGDTGKILEQSTDDLQIANLHPLLHRGGQVALMGCESEIPRPWSDSGLEVKVRLTDGVVMSIDAHEHHADLQIPEIHIITRACPTAAALAVQQALTRNLNSSGSIVKTCSLLEAGTKRSGTFISLLEYDEPWTISMSADSLEQFQLLVSSAKYLLWVTQGGLADKGEASLQFSPTTGLLRTIRTETPQITLPHLDLSRNSALGAQREADLAVAALHLSMQERYRGKPNEMEFIESGGELLISRVYADMAFDHELALHSGQLKSIPGSLHASGAGQENKRLKLEANGLSIRDGVWTQDETIEAIPLARDEVEMQVSHVSVDTAEHILPQESREAFGRIVRLGSDVRDLAVDDRVVMLVDEPGGAVKTYIRQHCSLVQRVPDGVKPEEAVSLPLNFMACYHALAETGRLVCGETVLVHGMSKAAGQAAVQVAMQLGAGAVFIAVADKVDEATQAASYGPTAPRFVHDSEQGLTAALSEMTGGRGVDVVLSGASGRALHSATETVGLRGRFIHIGTESMKPSDISAAFFDRSATVSRADARRLDRQKRAELLGIVFQLYRSGRIAPLAAPVYSIDAAVWPEAQELPGKMVVELGTNAVIPTRPGLPVVPALDADASYIISGGLGALGLTIAKQMVIYGARHLVMLSRSGVTSDKQEEALRELRGLGCQVDTLTCDVTVPSQVEEVARTCVAKQWKLRGLIQCAMVLQDSIFQNMDIEKWHKATHPKIAGTWNLHSLLPTDLDFFILLSSMSGIIGNSGQSNYCAGNTYEDALARHRRAQGLAATSLNIGLVTDASHFSEASTIDEYLKTYGHWAPALVTDREMQVVIGAVMRAGEAHGDTPDQLLVGVSDDVRRDARVTWSQDRKFDHRTRHLASDEAAAAGGAILNSRRRLEDELGAAATVRDAVAIVESALRSNVAAAMTASPDDIDVERPLYSFGVDSLKAVEVRNWIFKELRCDVSVFDLLSPVPLAKLALSIVAHGALTQPKVASQALGEM